MVSGQAFIDVSLPQKLKDSLLNIFLLERQLNGCLF
nr:MAG TPA: hypothetical protein [Caudoviricetes sp.]DAT41197.1 MAG TPA: hypothetical protein [Caudoviricetes sp.]